MFLFFYLFPLLLIPPLPPILPLLPHSKSSRRRLQRFQEWRNRRSSASNIPEVLWWVCILESWKNIICSVTNSYKKNKLWIFTPDIRIPWKVTYASTSWNLFSNLLKRYAYITINSYADIKFSYVGPCLRWGRGPTEHLELVQTGAPSRCLQGGSSLHHSSCDLRKKYKMNISLEKYQVTYEG